MTKETWGGYGLFHLILLGKGPLSSDIRSRTQAGQESGCSKKHNEWELLTDLLPIVCSELRTFTGTHLPRGLDLLLSVSIPENAGQSNQKANLMKHFLNWESLFLNNSSFVKLTKNNQDISIQKLLILIKHNLSK